MKNQFKFQVGDTIKHNSVEGVQYDVVRRLCDVDTGSLLYELTDGTVMFAASTEANYVLCQPEE